MGAQNHLEQKANVQNEKAHTIIGAQNHLEQKPNVQNEKSF